MPEHKGERYDQMVTKKSGDELGLFEQYEEALELVRHMILESGASSVTDFGCGTGNLCGPLSPQIRVIGIDKSPEMLELGRRKFPGMHFIEDSFSGLLEDEPTADVTVSSYVLHGLDPNVQQHVLDRMMALSTQRIVLLLDLMFETHATRSICREKLLASGRADLWEFLDSKSFFIIEELKPILEARGIQADFTHIANFTWLAALKG